MNAVIYARYSSDNQREALENSILQEPIEKPPLTG